MSQRLTKKQILEKYKTEGIVQPGYQIFECKTTGEYLVKKNVQKAKEEDVPKGNSKGSKAGRIEDSEFKITKLL